MEMKEGCYKDAHMLCFQKTDLIAKHQKAGTSRFQS